MSSYTIFSCPSCKQKMSVDTSWCGKTVECPFCYSRVVFSLKHETHKSSDKKLNRIAVAPSNGFDMNDIYGYLYAALREGKEFPVKNAEGFAVVRTTLAIRGEHPRFTSAGDIL